jgi:GTP-binding protein HflX
LPHSLVESFKSTLDEVRESDILVHVVDLSHPGFEEQIEVVNQTLAEIQANDKPTMMVFNKVDAWQPADEDPGNDAPEEKQSLESLKKHWIARNNPPAIFISATQKTNLDEFRDILYYNVKAIHTQRYPYDKFLF